MGIALCIKSNNDSAGKIRDLWRVVGRFEDQPSMEAIGYPPHFTFAIYDGNAVSEERARRIIETIAAGETAMRLSFDSIGSFTAPSLVLWMSPSQRTALDRMHATIHSAIDPDLCRPYYRPGAWTPHCTLANQIRPDSGAEALAFAASYRESIEVVFDAVDCIRFPPLEIALEKPLSGIAQ